MNTQLDRKTDNKPLLEDDLIRLCFDDKPEVIIKGKPDGEIDRYVPRVEKIKNELCVSERMTLVDGIKRTIDFHMKN